MSNVRVPKEMVYAFNNGFIREVLEPDEMISGSIDATRGALRDVLALLAGDVHIVLGQKQGHMHRVPGFWDDSGQPCSACAARERLAQIFGCAANPWLPKAPPEQDQTA